MARELNRLSALFVNTVSADSESNGSKLYSDGGNLHLQVTPSGAKSWLFRYTLDGKALSLGLGPLHTVSLDDARAEAGRLRVMLRGGKDPKIELTRERREADLDRRRTFKAFAVEFIEGLKPTLRSAKAHAQWSATMERYVYPVIGDVPLADVDVHMILKIMTQENSWLGKPETMRRILQRLERILGAAAVWGYRSAENPARYKNYLSEVLPRQKSRKRVVHHPSLHYTLIPAFMSVLRQQPPTVSYKALEFTNLTAARTGEVIGARWEEFNLEAKTWVVPADRMKAAREHHVPLSNAALAVVESQRARVPESCPYVFPSIQSGKHLSQMGMLQAMRGMHERGLLPMKAVPHGLRASFRSWAASATSFPRELAESALAHVLSAVEGAYQRDPQLERRRELMEAWAEYCGSYSCAQPEPR